jgi:hypothetical protein
MAVAVTDATASRNPLGSPCRPTGRFVTLAAAEVMSISTTLKPTNQHGSNQLHPPQKALGSGMKAPMVHLTRVLEGRGRGARAMTTQLRSKTGQSPWPLKTCRSKIGTIDQRRFQHRAAASNTPSRRNLFLLIAVPPSVCRLQRAASTHIDLRQNRSEHAPAVVHPLQMSVPRPLKIGGKNQGVSPVPARLAWIHTSHTRIAPTQRRMTNGTPLDLRQTVRY